MNVAVIATAVLQALPALISAGQDVVDLITSANSVISAAQANGSDPTAADWATIESKIHALEAQLNAGG